MSETERLDPDAEKEPSQGPKYGRTAFDWLHGATPGFKRGWKRWGLFFLNIAVWVVSVILWGGVMLFSWFMWGFGPMVWGIMVTVPLLPLLWWLARVEYNRVLVVDLDVATHKFNIGLWEIPTAIWHTVEWDGFTAEATSAHSGARYILARSFDSEARQGKGVHPSGYTFLHLIADAELFDKILEDLRRITIGGWRGLVQGRQEFLTDRDEFARYIDSVLFGRPRVKDFKDPHEGFEKGIKRKAQTVPPDEEYGP